MDGNPGEKLHYLDNASTTFPKPPAVLRAMADFAAGGCVSPSRASYDLAMQADAALRECRKRVCALFNGPAPERVVFGHNATDALNLVIFGMLRGGGHVVSTRLEHNSVLRPIRHCMDDFGARATLVPFDGQGYVDPAEIRGAITKETRLVVVSHASNVLGSAQAIGEIGAICHEAEVPFCIDAAQSAGVLPIDMEAMHVDIVAFTGHKSLMGPTGTGGLCVGADVEIPHSRAGGTGVKSAVRRHLDRYPFRLEYGTPNLMGLVGLSAGIAHISERGGEAAIGAEEMRLAGVLDAALRSTEGVEVYGPELAQPRVPVVAFNVVGTDPAEAGTRLDVDYEIACRTGLHCAPLVHETLGTAPTGAIRFSIGPATTREDVEAAAAAVGELARERRR